MNNVKVKNLYEAIIKGKGRNIFCLRLNGLDELFIKMNEGDPDPNLKVLRVNTNRFTGVRVVTLKLEQWDRFSIDRILQGTQSVAINGVATVEGKQYSAAGGTIVEITDIKDQYKYVKMDLNQSHLHRACNSLISDLVGLENLVLENHNQHTTHLSLSNTLRLNQGSQYSGVVYEISAPGNGRALSILELRNINDSLEQNDRVLPNGKVYLKIPTKTNEMILCGSPDALKTYERIFESSAIYTLYDESNGRDGKKLYVILPTIDL